MIPASRRRLLVLYAVVGALLITLGGRLWYLQVMNGHSYVQLASQDQTRYPGVSAGVNPVAHYPQPNGADPAQVLGYLGPITAEQMKQQHLPTTGFAGVDLVGQAGLEQQYNQDLQGTPGQEVLS